MIKMKHIGTSWPHFNYSTTQTLDEKNFTFFPFSLTCIRMKKKLFILGLENRIYLRGMLSEMEIIC
jgi:hypothetical protein